MIRSYGTRRPAADLAAFVAANAEVIGDVDLGRDASVWFGCVVRGDVHRIVVGEGTNLQDLTMVHVTGGRFSTTIGAEVTVGHRALLHGCTIGDRCLIGMGAIILDGAVVEPGAIVAAGALVPPGGRVAAGTLVLGSPARFVRPVTPAEAADIERSARKYVELARDYARGGCVEPLP